VDVPEARVQGVLAVGFHVEEHPVFAGEVLGYLVETISGRDQAVSGFSLFSDGSDGCFQLHWGLGAFLVYFFCCLGILHHA
jgi:hypothetical protein